MQVPFGEWLPDLPDHVNPGATQAKNVFPAVNSYRPFNSISNTSSNALTARGQGGRAFKSDSGVVSIFAGDATKLYRLVANSFVDESGGTTFSTASEGYWDFVRFGETVIAFNGIEKEDLDHESFVINKYKKDNELTFCKTVRKPYDIAVWHMLYFIHKETNAFSEISRDR